MIGRAALCFTLALAAGCGGSPARPSRQPVAASAAEEPSHVVAPAAGNYHCIIGPAPSSGSAASPTELPCQLSETDDGLSLASGPEGSGWRLSGRARGFAGGLQLTGELVSPDGDRAPVTLDLYRQAAGFAATWAGKDGVLIEIDLVPAPATETR